MVFESRTFRYVNIHGRFYPMIPVIVKGKHITRLYALVDSGAVVSLFHTSIAEDASINLSDAHKEYLAGIGGYVQAHIKDKVTIEIEELGELSIPVAFTEYISSDMAILGRQGFFEKFEVIFREWKKELEIKVVN
ncbi:MAG: retropepsin-like domain-containing protein [archaeon GB-1867-035]|nr:retropepsin-like domain-containing protein [Candidatus Culexmicrobium profundum]